jgi:lipopolysaccharide biosynthesis regulator YciM
LAIVVLVSVVALPANPAWAGKSVDSYPANVRQHFIQGEKLRNQQRYKEAAAAYNEAIRMGMGDCAEIYLPLAECYRKLGEHAQVVATCTRLIEEFDLSSACRH